MREIEFKEWLENHEIKRKATTIDNRIANCKTIEDSGYSLDNYYDENNEEQLFELFTYTKENELNNDIIRHRVLINGDLRTGTSTYKSAIKLYFEFRNSIQVTTDKVHPTTILNSKIVDFIESFNYQPNCHTNSCILQNDLLNDLMLNFSNFNWEMEKRVSKKYKDRIDIFGEINDYKIVIELDTTRADQVAKKFLSRMALLEKENVQYIAICYPGTKSMPANEVKKYFNYCTILANSLSESSRTKKTFTGIILNN